MGGVIRIGTAEAGRGQQVWGKIEVPPTYANRIGAPRIALVNGALDGPMLYVGAGAHGDEYNGIEAVRQAALALNPQALRGTVIFVPIQNYAAFRASTRRTPADDMDLDYCYPGNPEGSPTEVLAHVLFHQVVVRADFVLDLHTATRGGRNLMHALTAPETPEASVRARRLAKASGARVIVALEPPKSGHLGESMGWNLDHNLFVQASARGIPATILEFGEAGRLEADQVSLAIRGIQAILEDLGMVEEDSSMATRSRADAVLARESIAVRCRSTGFLHLLVEPGDVIEEGQLLARVIGLPNKVEEVRSPDRGIVVRIATDGVVKPGERIVVFASNMIGRDALPQSR